MRDSFSIDRFFTFSNYVIWFFLGNLYFILCNIPLTAYFINIRTKNINSSLLLFSICLIPIGPSLTALFYTMGKLVRNKDINLTKDYFSSYRKNFFQSLVICCIQVAIFMMLYTNIQFFKNTSYGYIIIPFFYAVIFLVVLMTFYIYPLISRFYMKNLDLIKASLVITITKPLITIGNIIIILFAMMLIDLKASYSILFIASITCYLVIFFERDLLKSLE